MTFFDRHFASSQAVMLGLASAFFGLVLEQSLVNIVVMYNVSYDSWWSAFGFMGLQFLIQIALAFFILSHARLDLAKGALAASSAAAVGFCLLNIQMFSALVTPSSVMSQILLVFLLPQLAILFIGQFLGGILAWVKSRQHVQEF